MLMWTFEHAIFRPILLAVGPYSGGSHFGYNSHSKLVPNAEEHA
jgi:hypothetical protein